MRRAVFLGVAFLAIAPFVAPIWADDSEQKDVEAKHYTVFAKLTREWIDIVPNRSDGKRALEKVTIRIPEITTLEGTRAEYSTSEQATTTAKIGFRLQVEIRPASKNKVLLDVTAEDNSGVFVVMKNAQRVVRQVALGKLVNLELYRNDNAERVTVELRVQEAADEKPGLSHIWPQPSRRRTLSGHDFSAGWPGQSTEAMARRSAKVAGSDHGCGVRSFIGMRPTESVARKCTSSV